MKLVLSYVPQRKEKTPHNKGKKMSEEQRWKLRRGWILKRASKAWLTFEQNMLTEQANSGS